MSFPGDERGITLIEIIVVVAILALVMSVATPMVAGITLANLKSASGNVSGAIRYMFNTSAMNGSYCRMRFELQGTGYLGECSDRPMYLARELETAGAEGERAVLDDEERVGKFGMDEEEMRMRESRKPRFSEIKSSIMKKAKLPEGIRFEGIWTGHQKDRFTKGQGYLYFFPGGYTERAYIHLADEKGRIFTLIVAPLTGKVSVYNEYVEAPEK
jgi:general secretion pathway protein H